ERRKWIDEASYLHALNFCMLLPGPEAQQLATYVGWRLHGVRGGIVAGALFVAPGAVVMAALAWIYVVYGSTSLLSALFFGVKAAVVAFVAEAIFKIGKRALKRRADVAVAATSFLALAVLGAPFPLVILAALLAGYLNAPPASAATDAPSTKAASTWRVALVWIAVWLAPLAASFALLGPDHVVTRVGVLFAGLALVTFGGAYAVLAWLADVAVRSEHWLTAAQMADGLGLAETTPGPLVLVNQFVGFLAGWSEGGIVVALLAAAMASWQTFAPSFVWIFAGAPYADAFRRNPRIESALRMVTAAVLGVVAALAFWFAVHVLFTRTAPLATPWGRVIDLPALASFDPAAAAIALAAAFALIRLKLNPLAVVAAAAAAGAAARLLA
ncbi:MAG: chromate efflux transporter, partial [Parvularculaceae bacterium]|nr:chromate efflux transporter [Parvularculaceae bacterium]